MKTPKQNESIDVDINLNTPISASFHDMTNDPDVLQECSHVRVYNSMPDAITVQIRGFRPLERGLFSHRAQPRKLYASANVSASQIDELIAALTAARARLLGRKS